MKVNRNNHLINKNLIRNIIKKTERKAKFNYFTPSLRRARTPFGKTIRNPFKLKGYSRLTERPISRERRNSRNETFINSVNSDNSLSMISANRVINFDNSYNYPSNNKNMIFFTERPKKLSDYILKNQPKQKIYKLIYLDENDLNYIRGDDDKLYRNYYSNREFNPRLLSKQKSKFNLNRCIRNNNLMNNLYKYNYKTYNNCNKQKKYNNYSYIDKYNNYSYNDKYDNFSYNDKFNNYSYNDKYNNFSYNDKFNNYNYNDKFNNYSYNDKYNNYSTFNKSDSENNRYNDNYEYIGNDRYRNNQNKDQLKVVKIQSMWRGYQTRGFMKSIINNYFNMMYNINCLYKILYNHSKPIFKYFFNILSQRKKTIDIYNNKNKKRVINKKIIPNTGSCMSFKYLKKNNNKNPNKIINIYQKENNKKKNVMGNINVKYSIPCKQKVYTPAKKNMIICRCKNNTIRTYPLLSKKMFDKKRMGKIISKGKTKDSDIYAKLNKINRKNLGVNEIKKYIMRKNYLLYFPIFLYRLRILQKVNIILFKYKCLYNAFQIKEKYGLYQYFDRYRNNILSQTVNHIYYENKEQINKRENTTNKNKTIDNNSNLKMDRLRKKQYLNKSTEIPRKKYIKVRRVKSGNINDIFQSKSVGIRKGLTNSFDIDKNRKMKVHRLRLDSSLSFEFNNNNDKDGNSSLVQKIASIFRKIGEKDIKYQCFSYWKKKTKLNK